MSQPWQHFLVRQEPPGDDRDPGWRPMCGVTTCQAAAVVKHVTQWGKYHGEGREYVFRRCEAHRIWPEGATSGPLRVAPGAFVVPAR